MKKILLNISGLYLVLLGCLFASAFILFMISRGTFDGLRPAFYLLMIGIPVYLIATGNGILAKKCWARSSLIISSTLTLLSGLVLFATVLFARLPIMLTAFVPQFFILGFLLVFMILIPASFIYFFQRASVRTEIFKMALPTTVPQRRPVGCLLIAVFWAFNAAATALLLLNTSIEKAPFIGSVTLSGWSLLIYFLILTAVFLYNSLSLLRMLPSAWWTNIMTSVFIISTGMLNVLFITENVFRELTRGSMINISLFEYKAVSLLSLLIPVVIIIYLIRKKDLFISSK